MRPFSVSNAVSMRAAVSIIFLICLEIFDALKDSEVGYPLISLTIFLCLFMLVQKKVVRISMNVIRFSMTFILSNIVPGIGDMVGEFFIGF